MQIHYLSEQNSLLTHYLSEIRDVTIQTDRLRFRKNMERIGEIMAYEISKSFAPRLYEFLRPG
jgi:uracil phosphoribosyltransferase